MGEVEDEDRWLEEVESEQALKWVREKNEGTLAALGDPTETDLCKKILSILDSKDKIPNVTKRGHFLYNIWMDENNPRGLWRRCSMEEYEKENPNWEIVLDIDALGKKEGESWVWGGVSELDEGSGVHTTRVLMSLSRGGSDAKVVREFDTVAKDFIAPENGGFYVPECKSRVCYMSRDELVIGTNWGEGSLTDSGYPREIRYWKRGTPLQDASPQFEGEKGDVAVTGYITRHKAHRFEWRSRATSFFSSKKYVRAIPLGTEGVPGEWKEVPLPETASVSTFADQVLIKLRDPWTVGGRVYESSSLLSAPLASVLDAPDNASWTALFEPSDTTFLRSWTRTKNNLVLQLLDNVLTVFQVWQRTEEGWKDLGRGGGATPENVFSVSASAVDDDECDEVWLTKSSFNLPSTLSILDISGGVEKTAPKVLKSLPHQFNAAGVTAVQRWAVSKDGTKIPYFLISPPNVVLDGSTPTLLSAYGGFEIPRLPAYDAEVGAGWLEKGYCYAVANIRGGGEFGPKWHQAALKENRQKAFDDLYAVAEQLVKDGVTGHKRLAVRGGSNGGLLVGNALVQRPQLWGALVCEVPLLDMKRFNKLLAGASWMAEYGNPDTDDWQYLQKYSPYHNVDDGAAYPPILLTTSTRDDRVHPAHARKMVRRLTAASSEGKHPTLYYENIEGGHGGAADNKQRAFMKTLAFAFLSRELTK